MAEQRKVGFLFLADSSCREGVADAVRNVIDLMPLEERPPNNFWCIVLAYCAEPDENTDWLYSISSALEIVTIHSGDREDAFRTGMLAISHGSNDPDYFVCVEVGRCRWLKPAARAIA